MKYAIKVTGSETDGYVVGLAGDGRFICDGNQTGAVKWPESERARARLMILCVGERARLVKLRPRTSVPSSQPQETKK